MISNILRSVVKVKLLSISDLGLDETPFGNVAGAAEGAWELDSTIFSLMSLDEIEKYIFISEGAFN